MKTIKLRDFQRNFCKLSKDQMNYEVVDQSGAIIGTWLSGLVRQSNGAKYPLLDRRIGPDIIAPVGQAEESQLIEETSKCDKCKKYDSEWYGIVYEEGEDEKNIGLCDMCYRIFKPRNFKKI